MARALLLLACLGALAPRLAWGQQQTSGAAVPIQELPQFS